MKIRILQRCPFWRYYADLRALKAALKRQRLAARQHAAAHE